VHRDATVLLDSAGIARSMKNHEEKMMARNKAQRDNSQALAAFMTNKDQIDQLLAALKNLSDEHFNVSPEDVNWGHVGSQSYWLERLQQVARFAGILPEE